MNQATSGKKKREPLRIFGIHINQNIIIYMVCVLIAAILWMLNALNKDYISEISYPIKYTDFPKERYLTSTLPANITIEVQAKGFSLLSNKVNTSFQPIVLHVKTYNQQAQKKNGYFEYVLKLNDIREKITAQLRSDIKVLHIQPEELVFTFSKAASKKVAIKPDVNFQEKKGYILKGHILCTPDSITVQGPAAILDTLTYIPTVKWQKKEIKKDIDFNLRLIQPEHVYFEEKEVRAKIQIERFTEGQRSIPLKAINLPKNMEIKLFPATLDVTYDVGLSKYEQVKDQDFTLVVDYNEIENTAYIPVKLVDQPDYIKNLKYIPQKVEFILEQK